MEIRQLRYFVAIVDSGSLSRAAALVHIVQPALSQQMTQLEEELGTQLLQRSVKGVTPTDAGQALYRHAQQILKLAGDTKNVVKASDAGLSGRVRLGLPSSIAMVLVGPLIAALEERHPQIVLEVYESPSTFLAAHLINERVELSVLVDDVALPGIEAVPLVDEPLYFVQPRRKPLVRAGRSIDLPTVASVPLMLTTQVTTLRDLVDRAFAEAGVAPQIKAEASSIHTVLAMVAQGGAGTVIPHSALAWHAAAQLLRQTPIEPQIVRRATLAHSRLNRLQPAAACVHALVVSVVRELVRSRRWDGARLVTGS
ncbi:LysR family transcriptional regulator, nitrogen assimilation regulatory protein [Variovorax sp. PDC80]|uniref:LysR substrate-binding domain-containing protein n=1 Tax=Variovorax sp. PDC80 TaxID=1882827 RepID=UPI0008DFC80D|nr:LysR substrate-binding domain-containing protein [Variovorax sp. PDC80]SFP28428.1 LysR family transcriptional regulator, nitrogen assimilation regulatory protein [Variovorax sp. PDC80]